MYIDGRNSFTWNTLTNRTYTECIYQWWHIFLQMYMCDVVYPHEDDLTIYYLAKQINDDNLTIYDLANIINEDDFAIYHLANKIINWKKKQTNKEMAQIKLNWDSKNVLHVFQLYVAVSKNQLHLGIHPLAQCQNIRIYVFLSYCLSS